MALGKPRDIEAAAFEKAGKQPRNIECGNSNLKSTVGTYQRGPISQNVPERQRSQTEHL